MSKPVSSKSQLLALREAFVAHRLAHALSRLGGVTRFMNTGAHPDDEHSTLLAWLRYGMGLQTSILSSTRGEGGQNCRGPERGLRLGLLRSHEMERAAKVLDAEIYWLDRGLNDPLFDFGFSKSGQDTLQRWGGRAAVVERVVRLFRQVRPDIILPTFLDVPGQHGHHRAMTAAALEAWRLSGDPAYITEGLPPWTIAKAYLPAWSGGGSTYDDELPPPPATLFVRAEGVEPLTGARWTDIGEAARLCHSSQDMGSPARPNDEIWSLHRVGHGPSDPPAEADLLDGLPRGLADLPNAPAAALRYDALVAEIKATPEPQLPEALAALDITLDEISATADPAFLAQEGHRLRQQKQALDAAILLALDALPERITLTPRQAHPGGTISLRAEPETSATLHWHLPQGFSAAQSHAAQALDCEISDTAPPIFPFEPLWSPLGGAGAIFAEASLSLKGRSYTASVATDLPFEIIPRNAQPENEDILLPLPLEGPASLPLPFDEETQLSLPQGVTQEKQSLRITEAISPGLYDLRPMQNGAPYLQAYTATLSDGPAEAPTGETLCLYAPLNMRLLAFPLQRPRGRIGYVTGTDGCLPWLRKAGFEITEIPSFEATTDLTTFDTLLIGAVAFGKAPGLAKEAAVAQLRAFVERGGTLVTFYQRPDQGWPEGGLGLDRLEIGIPSLRWRVTDPNAPVRVLAEEAPLFTAPNPITETDWQGWDKERGLYFASRWGAGYQPLLSMADEGEQPLHGALLYGAFGQGKHIHCALTLHHQLANLVPGAYRLMANILDSAPNSSPA